MAISFQSLRDQRHPSASQHNGAPLINLKGCRGAYPTAEAPDWARTGSVRTAATPGAPRRLFDPDGGRPRWLRLAQRAWRLVVSGEKSLAVWAVLAVEAIWARYARNERTAATVAAEIRRLFRYLQAMGAERLEDVTCELVTRWFWAARPDRVGRMGVVSASTACKRQWYALVCFEELARLGAPISPSALVGPRIERPAAQESARPLSDEEFELARDHSDSELVTSRRPLLFAMAVAGGTATELAELRRRDIDFAAGTVTFSGAAARTNPLDEWSIATARRWLLNQPQAPALDAAVCVTDGLDLARGARSVSVRLGDVLRDAGLSGRPGLTARSIRLTTARRVLDVDGIEAAARFLGAVSLDAVAAALRHDWRCGDA